MSDILDVFNQIALDAGAGDLPAPAEPPQDSPYRAAQRRLREELPYFGIMGMLIVSVDDFILAHEHDETVSVPYSVTFLLTRMYTAITDALPGLCLSVFAGGRMDAYELHIGPHDEFCDDAESDPAGDPRASAIYEVVESVYQYAITHQDEWLVTKKR